MDYIFVGGYGSEWEDQWWIDMLIELGWDPTKDRVLFIEDPRKSLAYGSIWEIGDQYAELEDAIKNGGYKDIKLIGHSEGAATIAKFLDRIADDDNYLADTNVRSELKGAVLLDMPTGFTDFAVLNWDDAALVDLPERLSRVSPQANLADIHGTWIHAANRPGWEGLSLQVYDPWLIGYGPEGPYSYVNPDFITGHSKMRLEKKTVDRMRSTFGTK